MHTHRAHVSSHLVLNGMAPHVLDQKYSDCPRLPGSVTMQACCFLIIINSALFLAQMWPKFRR